MMKSILPSAAAVRRHLGWCWPVILALSTTIGTFGLFSAEPVVPPPELVRLFLPAEAQCH